MAGKADFTPDEWQALLGSPLVVGVAILAADPGSIFGMLKESMASARALVAASKDPSVDALIKAVATDFETSEGRRLAQQAVTEAVGGDKPADIRPRAVETLKRVSAILDAKAPAELACLQDLACGCREDGGGSGLRRRFSRLRRRASERRGKGDAGRHRRRARGFRAARLAGVRPCGGVATGRAGRGRARVRAPPSIGLRRAASACNRSSAVF